MSQIIIYYAHPGQGRSQINARMAKLAQQQHDINFVDLYADYPRLDINIDKEQQRLLDHDVIVFQFPLFWYSTPSIIKEWQDLVLEHGFAYGEEGTYLKDKKVMLAVTAGGSEAAYREQGHHHHSLRTFLRPFEQTVNLCNMQFCAPYVLYESLNATEVQIDAHCQGYVRLINALRDDSYNFEKANVNEWLTHEQLTIEGQA